MTATKPLDVGGAVVRGLHVRFEGGRAVEIEADENADAVRARCARDEGASESPEDVARVNRSAIHMDFMIGSNEVSVTGVTGSGERVPVLQDGTWQV